jgi:hypothetical protein
MAAETTVNVTLTLLASQVEYLDNEAKVADTNRSQIARKIFREKIAAEKSKK